MANTSPIVVCSNCQTPNRVPAGRLADAPRCGKCKDALFQGRPMTLTDATFDAYLGRDDVPLVVDFWAPWCGPCKVMAPSFEQAARKLEPRARLAKVNTDENPRLASRYGISSIPTTAVFRAGSELARQAGALTLPQLLQWIRAQL